MQIQEKDVGQVLPIAAKGLAVLLERLLYKSLIGYAMPISILP